MFSAHESVYLQHFYKRQTLLDLRITYVQFCASQKWVHIWSATRGSPGGIQNPTHCNLIKPQHRRLAACVIAQQYSPVTFRSLRFYSSKEKFAACQNLCYFKFLYFSKTVVTLKLCNLQLCQTGSVCIQVSWRGEAGDSQNVCKNISSRELPLTSSIWKSKIFRIMCSAKTKQNAYHVFFLNKGCFRMKVRIKNNKLFGNPHAVPTDYMTIKFSEHAQNHRARIFRRSKFRPLR